MITRIQKVIQLKKLTSSAFADKIGVPRSTISHIISGRNNPSLEFVQKVLDNFPDIRTEWLVRGEGHMLKASNTLFPDEEYQETTPALNQGEELQENLTQDNSVEKSEAESTSLSQGHFSGQGAGKKNLKESEEDKKTVEPFEKTAAIGAKENKTGELSDKHLKRTVRVMMFYSDGSFSEHFPSQ